MSVTKLFSDDPTIVNRYLAGQLDDAERVVFEAELARNPAALAELEATARLKVGLERLRETGELFEELRSQPMYTRPLFLASAAAVAALVIGFSFLRGAVFSHPGAPLLAARATSFISAQGAALPPGNTFAVYRKRVDGYDTVVELPATAQAIELRVLPQMQARSGRYKVSLAHLREDDSLEPANVVTDVKPDGDGFLSVFADSSRLARGRYRLTVSGDERIDPGAAAPGAAADVFLLRVIRAAE